MNVKPDNKIADLKQSWSREQHHARVLYAVNIIDITPACIAAQPRTPEQRPNRRVVPVKLLTHQVDRAIAVDAHAERRALEAANAALHPMHRSLAMRMWRAVRGMFRR